MGAKREKALPEKEITHLAIVAAKEKTIDCDCV
jgi:hypothetical protein